MISVIARIAVPFFFLVSGYYSYPLETINNSNDGNYRSRLKKRIIRYLLLCIGLNVVYIGKETARVIFHKITFSEFWEINFQPEFWVANFGASGHIWFVRALLYMAIIEYLFYKGLNSRGLKYLLILIWLFDVFVIKYSFLFDIDIAQPWKEIISKFICNAFLYYFLGRVIRKESLFLMRQNEDIGFERFKIIICIVFLYLEYFVLEYFHENEMPANYIMIFPLAIFLFKSLIIHSEWGKGSFITFIGMNLSMYVYYWHVLIGSFVCDVCDYINVPKSIGHSAITVFAFSVMAAYILWRIKYWYFSRNSTAKND